MRTAIIDLEAIENFIIKKHITNKKYFIKNKQ